MSGSYGFWEMDFPGLCDVTVTVPSRTTGFSVPINLTYGLFASRRSLGSLACSVAGSAVFRQHLGGLLAVLEKDFQELLCVKV